MLKVLSTNTVDMTMAAILAFNIWTYFPVCEGHSQTTLQLQLIFELWPMIWRNQNSLLCLVSVYTLQSPLKESTQYHSDNYYDRFLVHNKQQAGEPHCSLYSNKHVK